MLIWWEGQLLWNVDGSLGWEALKTRNVEQMDRREMVWGKLVGGDQSIVCFGIGLCRCSWVEERANLNALPTMAATFADQVIPVAFILINSAHKPNYYALVSLSLSTAVRPVSSMLDSLFEKRMSYFPYLRHTFHLRVRLFLFNFHKKSSKMKDGFMLPNVRTHGLPIFNPQNRIPSHLRRLPE